MADLSRAAHLQRLIGRIERLIQRGAEASSYFTKWRLAIFLTGLACTITLYKSGWYSAG
ncbi:MAG: hypothetical protein HY038_05350 [Nitrospirae bacterium]|nr:hypothetical protein [Nitrospirota bacterium]